MTVMAKLLAPVLMAGSTVSAMLVEPKPSAVATFEEYHAAYSKDYKPESEEYEKRKALFTERKAHVEAHNSKEKRKWTAEINHLSDRTEDELKALRGWIHHSAGSNGGGYVAAGFLAERSHTFTEPDEAVDWRHLKSTKVKDQGGCGSCWAVASATMLELNHEIHMGTTRSFSEQELVSCVANPKECGGTGGCQGATAELALEYAVGSGLATREETPYHAMDLHCKAHARQTALARSGNIAQVGSHHQAGAAFGLVGWSTLPSNKAEPLMLSLMEGPVAVAVGASEWMPYREGIFDSCNPNSIIDHAVLAVGYGFEEKDDGQRENYWTIQNSWGSFWGEHGYIRLERMATPAEDEQYCGTDTKPEEGIACKPYPDSVTVCGMCGILYDSVAAHFDPAAVKTSSSSASFLHRV